MYVKLFASILDSSIWSEDYPTRLVWITLLTMADPEGVVGASVSGVARRAAVTRQEAAAAIGVLLSPDHDRPDQAHEGRRLDVVEGGWRVINYQKYREIRTQQQFRDALRQRRHRDKSRDIRDPSRDPSDNSQAVTVSASASASTSVVEGKGGVGEEGDARLTPEGRRAFVQLCRASHNPTALAAEVRMILDGGRPGVPTDPAAVSLALHDLTLSGGKVTGASLRAFVQRAAILPAQNLKDELAAWAAKP